MKHREVLGIWGLWDLTLVSASFALISSLVIGCGLRAESSAEDDEREREGQVPACEAGARNEKWDVDCTAACNHVLACKSTGDSDLQELTCNDCLGSCIAGVALGGNDLVESTEEDRTSWECAELVVGCSALDHNCDIF